MDPATGASLALAIYKDVYHLAISVYHLAESAQHYKAEQSDLVADFRSEVLYLSGFHKMFVSNRAGSLTGDEGLDTEFDRDIHRVIYKIQKLFSEYRGAALEEDERYRQQYLRLTEENEEVKNTFMLEDLTISPRGQSGQEQSDEVSSNKLGGWLKPVKDQPIYRLSAWKWALFTKAKLMHLIHKFHDYNQKLKDLVPLFLSNQCVSKHDLIAFELEIKNSQGADYSPFTQHIRIRRAMEIDDSEPRTPGNNLDLTDQDEKDRVTTSERTWIEYKSYQATADDGNNSGQSSMSGASRTKSELQASIHQLARLLFEAGSYNLHTLPFGGYKHEMEKNRFAFFFDYPPGVAASEPYTLNDMIENVPKSEKPSLSDRFRVAMIVTKALGMFHADGWLHKSMSSDAILIFRDTASHAQYSSPYLVGFEFSRRESDETYNTFDSDPKKNLYRHPERQGPPTAQFNRMHDAFALGVVLLEIGLWRTASRMQSDILRSLKLKYGDNTVLNPEGIQKGYLQLARQGLRHQMGQHYYEAVQTCLTGELADHLGKSNFGTIFLQSVTDKVDAKKLLH